MKPANLEDMYELSPTQEGMLVNSLIAPESGSYIQQQILAVKGRVDLPAFEQAWQAVVERHPAFRTAFHWKGLPKPIQVVSSKVRIALQELDWAGIPAADQKDRLEGYLQNDMACGFDLSQAPLMRLTMIRTGHDEYQFVWSSHHILLDAWSSSLVLAELMILYQAARDGRTVALAQPRPYREYIAWLRRQDLKAAETYWRAALAGFRTPVLPGAREASPSNPGRADGIGAEDALLSEALTHRLQHFARQQRLTVSTLVHAAWAILASRYSREDDVVLGITLSGRPTELAGVEKMVGLFINTLPLRAQIIPEAALEPWLLQVQARQAELHQYGFTPLVRVQAWSELPRGQRLFDSIVVFENIPVNRNLSAGNNGNDVESLTVHSGLYINWTEYPLALSVNLGANLSLSLNYDRGQFKSATVRRLLAQMELLLEGMLSGDGVRVRDLPCLTVEERDQVLAGWNATAASYPAGLCLDDLVARRASEHPEAVAVIGEQERLAYIELESRANRLGNYLCGRGMATGDLIGICLERSVSMVVAMLAILKAGGAYLPLDPSYPPARLEQILSDAKPAFILTEDKFVSLLNEAWQPKCCLVDRESTDILQGSPGAPPGWRNESQAAYVIYTSGSTGRPKGVVNVHAGVVNRLLWMQQEYDVGAGDVILQKTPFGFDVSVWEIFLPLISGARLVLARPGGQRDPQYLAGLIAREKITMIHFVPSMLRPFLESRGLAEKCGSLRCVICSGEELSPVERNRFFQVLPESELHNLYGPTEAAIDVTQYKCELEDLATSRVPIGRPIANTEIYVLDREMQPVPIGAIGELYLAGVQLARGYLNRPDLTSETFVPHCHGTRPGERLYRTGDLGRFRDDGNIEFLGRIDGQVKIRGHRIELGEIEAVLRRHPEVQQAAVVARERNGDKQLVAYVVLREKGSAEAAVLQSHLRENLPGYMTPGTIVRVRELPLNSNGKLDRDRLPEAEEERAGAEYEAPRNELEKAVAGIWAEILGLEQVGIRENFFDLGGHSLLLLRVHGRLQEVLQREIPLLVLFQYPMIDSLVRHIGGEQADVQPTTRISDEQMKKGIDRLDKLFRRATKSTS
jgi:amino acid adenylation domain-containing protein